MSSSGAGTEAVKRLTVSDIARMHADGVRIAMATAYDFPSARLLDEAGLPMLLVGDSVGRAILGYENEIPVSMDEMLHHTKAVVRGAKRAVVVGDMPFLSYASPEAAIENAGRFLSEGGAQTVKVEGGVRSARTIEALVKAGIPVMGHIGFTPQSINAHGQGAGAGEDPRRGALRPRRRARGPGGRRVRDGPRAPPGAARRGDHGAAADPDDRHRLRARLLRPGPGAHGPPRLRHVAPAPRPPLRRPPRHDPRGRAAYRADVESGTFPGEAETVRMDDAVLDDILGRSRLDGAEAEGSLEGIPLDHDL